MKVRKNKYYTRGTPEYNKMFARKIFCRRIKKNSAKVFRVIVVFGSISAIIYWVAIMLKSCAV